MPQTRSDVADLTVSSRSQAKRELHSFIVIFAMLGSINSLFLSFIALFYYIAIFSEIST